MASTECCASGTTYYNGRLTGSKTWGQPFEFPTFGGPIVFGYRLKDFQANVPEIKLSTWTYCAIANGTVSDWNDPAITADNGKSVTGGVSQTHHVLLPLRQQRNHLPLTRTSQHRVQRHVWQAPYNEPPYGVSGRSAAWTFGVNSTWPGPGSSGDPNPRFIGESGNPGVLAGIQSTPFGTGYVEGAYAGRQTRTSARRCCKTAAQALQRYS